MSADLEIQAMQTIVEVLWALDDEERARVLRWAVSRFVTDDMSKRPAPGVEEG